MTLTVSSAETEAMSRITFSGAAAPSGSTRWRTMIPWAPLSSTRATHTYSACGTRTTGTIPAPLGRGSVDGPLQLLSVAALTPGKGHDTLFRALASIPNRRWRLTCAGTLERHPPTAARMRALLREQGLDNQVWLGGELSEGMVADSYNRADVFVHPSLHETYGMVVAEALARGLPVVATNTGAIPDLIGDGAGLLVRPGDVDALAVALRQVMEDRELRERLAAGARRVRGRLPTWDQAAERMAAALERVAV